MTVDEEAWRIFFQCRDSRLGAQPQVERGFSPQINDFCKARLEMEGQTLDSQSSFGQVQQKPRRLPRLWTVASTVTIKVRSKTTARAAPAAGAPRKRCPRHLKAVSLRQRSARLPGGVGRNEHPRMAVEPQSEMGTADRARRGGAPLNGVWGMRRWPRVSSICCTILRNGSTVDAELYSGKKVMPLSTLSVMGITRIVIVL